MSVACDASLQFRVGIFPLKVFNNDGEASMSSKYDIFMLYFAEVAVNA